MKKFGTRAFVFGIPILLFVLFTTIFYFYKLSKVKAKMEEISQYKCLLMGDSQIQRIDEKMFTYKTKNVASTAENYYFTYHKLRDIIANKNRKTEKIILGVSIHSFASVYDRTLDVTIPEGKSSLRFLYFIPLFGSESLINFYDLPISTLVFGIYYKPDFGGFKESKYSNPDTAIINKTFNLHYSRRENEGIYSYTQRDYLHKIDSLCTVNNIELILVSTPFHSKYKEKIPKVYTDFYNETVDNMKNTLRINFLKDKQQDSLMSDASHLNINGSKFYSKKINAIIKEHE